MFLVSFCCQNKSPLRDGQTHFLPDSFTGRKVVIVSEPAVFMMHDTAVNGKVHPEQPLRVKAIDDALKAAGLLRKANALIPRQATKDEISLVHNEAYQIELLRQITAIKSPKEFNRSKWKFKQIGGDFVISPYSWDAAHFAAGAAISAIEVILKPNSQIFRAFCNIRPPGHHAHAQTGSGFCLFNNIAIAAEYLANQGFRVLIVDWDAHHGDGTQRLLEANKRIFYFSTHGDTSLKYDADLDEDTSFYPGPNWGMAKDKGGHNNVLNCPVPVAKTQKEHLEPQRTEIKAKARKEIIRAFEEKLIPAMDQFQPEFVLISCGFDAHENDTLVGLGLKTKDYEKLTNIVVNIANKYAKGRVVSVLEGGYNLQAIAESAVVHVKALFQQ